MTTTTSWAAGVSGDFNTASNWTDGVPGDGDTALITAKGIYTVTSSQFNSVGALEMAKTATLAINDDDLTVSSGTNSGALDGTISLTNEGGLQLGTDGGTTTFDNNGEIELNGSGISGASITILGTVVLDGKGKIDLMNDCAIFCPGGEVATLTNNSNTIFGSGNLGATDLPLVNAAKGIIDANSSANPMLLDCASFTNEGLLEATGSGTLELANDIIQIGKGEIKAAAGSGAAAFVDLEGITITGGTVSTSKGSVVLAMDAPTTIEPAKPISNAGLIEAYTGNLTIDDAVKNTGLLYAAESDLSIDGAVTGGTADIDQGSLTFAGPSSTKVSFNSGATGVLVLDDATKFTGTVSGMAASPGASIVLSNIGFADNISLSYAKGVLTVADATNEMTDKIKIVDGGNFIGQEYGITGELQIFDPPANVANVSRNNTAQLLVQSMAAFGAASGVVTSDGAAVADHRQSSQFLALPHHG